MNLILKENNPNLTVVNLENGVSFVHDNKTGKNYFSNKIIAECTGLDEKTVWKHWANFKELENKGSNPSLNLKVSNVNKSIGYYSINGIEVI